MRMTKTKQAVLAELDERASTLSELECLKGKDLGNSSRMLKSMEQQGLIVGLYEYQCEDYTRTKDIANPESVDRVKPRKVYYLKGDVTQDLIKRINIQNIIECDSMLEPTSGWIKVEKLNREATKHLNLN